MKKTVFVTIPMLPAESLKPVKYRKENTGKIFSEPSRFPSIPMLEWNMSADDEIKIVAVMADDEAGRSKANLETYKAELAKLSEDMGIQMEINEVIVLPHEETKKKQVQLFKEISKHYDNASEIYMDVTYGTKITSIGLFSSLVYADKVKGCDIKTIIYGKYAHTDGETGEIYDLRCLYDLNMLIHAAEFMPANDIEDLINDLWG